jgi:hypothetical protein
MADHPTDDTLSISELTERRERTEAVSGWIRQRLEQHLETLRPAFDPRRLLGRHAGSGVSSRDDIPGSDAALQQLTQRYAQVCGAPFSLRNELPPEVLAGIDRRLELYPYEYPHLADDGRDKKTIRITSPLRWVLSYASGYSLAQLDRALAKQEDRRESDVRQFVVNALVMGAMLERFPALRLILSDLRFEVSSTTREGLGKLPLVTIASHLPSQRPPDDLVFTITGFSGVAAFIEVIERDPLANLRDPLREALEAKLRK